jgi:glycosyltransferase involved in cell wall biosynthesis
MTATISVVVPMFNRAATILATLDSVAAQSLPPDRLVVVDDGSTDSSARRVANWLQAHSRRVNGFLLTQPNRGVAVARNRGLTAASPCSLIAFLDSDDRWPSDFLERAAAVVDTCPNSVAATADREFQFGEIHEPEVHDLRSFAAAPIPWMLAHGAGIASATLFRVAAVLSRGGFDESLITGEDSALFLRLALDGPWLHIPGRPVIFERALSQQADAEGHLSERFHDRFRTWARVYEDFILHGGGKHVLTPAEIRRALGAAWYIAGRELMEHHRHVEARHCFFKALAWSPRSYKAWKWLARAYYRVNWRRRDTTFVARPV